MTKVQGSSRMSLATSDIKKVFLHAALVAASAVVAYILTVIPTLHIDNSIAMMLMPLIAAGFEALQKFLTDTTATVDETPSPPTM